MLRTQSHLIVTALFWIFGQFYRQLLLIKIQILIVVEVRQALFMLEQRFGFVYSTLQSVILLSMRRLFLNNSQNIAILKKTTVFLLIESKAILGVTATFMQIIFFHRILLFKLKNIKFGTQMSFCPDAANLLEMLSDFPIEGGLKSIVRQSISYTKFELLYDICHVEIFDEQFVGEFGFSSRTLGRGAFLLFEDLVEDVGIHCFRLRFQPFSLQRAFAQLEQPHLGDYEFRLDQSGARPCDHVVLIYLNLLHLNPLSFLYYNSNQITTINQINNFQTIQPTPN